MNKNLTDDLLPFKGVILSLVSYATHHKLAHLIEKLTPKAPSSIRFLIKMEIKRIAKPCTLVMDFRTMFDGCEEVEFQNQCHYLDAISKEIFIDSINQNNNTFSTFIYQEISEKAKKRYTTQQQQQLAKQAEAKNNSLNVTTATSISLSNNNYFHDDENSFHSKCKIFTYDPLGMSNNGKESIGITVELVDLNFNNCIFKTSTKLDHVPNQELYLWFYDHDKALDFESEITLPYTIIQQEDESGYCYYHLRVNDLATKSMTVLLTRLLQQKFLANEPHRQKQITPLIDSITAKSHEQFLSARLNDIPFTCAKFKSGWRPDTGLHTPVNSPLWNFMSIKNDLTPFSRLFSNNNIQTALENNQVFDQNAYILKHKYNDKFQFIIVWQSELDNDPKAKKLVESTILQGNFKYIRLNITPINAVEDAFVPSAVSSSTNHAMAFMNRPLCKATQTSLKSSHYFAVLSDITELNNVLTSPKQGSIKQQTLREVGPIKCLTKFFLPKLERKSQFKKVVLDLTDDRREERFNLSIDIEVTLCGKVPCTIKGHTSNISPKGLAIILDTPLKYTSGEYVNLSLNIPNSVNSPTKTIKLKNQRYQILSINSQQIRVVINGIEKKHDACQMLRNLIFNNLDDLQLVGSNPNDVYGMAQAIRNIYAKNHLSVPFFIHRDKRQWFINSLALNDKTKFPSLLNNEDSSDDMLVQLVNQEKFRNYCLIKLNKIEDINSCNTFYIVTVPPNSSSKVGAKSDNLFWIGDLSQLKKSGDIVEIMKKIRSLGNPTILGIKVSKPQKLLTKGFIDELHYLRKISPGSASKLIHTIEHVSGIGEIVDHTEQILTLFDSYSEKNTTVPLAKAS